MRTNWKAKCHALEIELSNLAQTKKDNDLLRLQLTRTITAFDSMKNDRDYWKNQALIPLPTPPDPTTGAIKQVALLKNAVQAIQDNLYEIASLYSISLDD